MSQLSRVAKVLRKNSKAPGVTAGMVAKLAGIPKSAVYRRVYDLRQEFGRTIYSNYRNVNGNRKVFYRITA